MENHQISWYVIQCHHVKLKDISWTWWEFWYLMILHDFLLFYFLAIIWVLPYRCYQMLLNVFQFNMVTLNGMSWCGKSDSKRYVPTCFLGMCMLSTYLYQFFISVAKYTDLQMKHNTYQVSANPVIRSSFSFEMPSRILKWGAKERQHKG